MERINGSADFIGINYYTTEIIFNQAYNISEVSYNADIGVGTTKDPLWYP